MAIQILCDCGKKLSAPDSAAGRIATCPGCGAVLGIPCGNLQHSMRILALAGIDDAEVADKILASFAAERGAGFLRFKRRVKETVGNIHVRDGQLEFVYRNCAMQAVSDQHDAQTADPIVESLFPYEEYLPVHDARTSLEHLALGSLGLNGTGIYRRDDPFWNRFSPPWGMTCRCGKNLLTLEAAARKGVAEAIEWQNSGSPPQEPAWVSLPRFDHEFTPCEILGVRGEVPYLLGKLTEEVADWVIETLGGIGRGARPAVSTILDICKSCQDESTQLTACVALWRITNQADILMPTLLDLLKSPDSAMRCQALHVFDELMPAASRGHPAVLSMLHDRDSLVRDAAIGVLAATEPNSPEVLLALTEALNDSDGTVRSHAANALMAFGRAARNALPTLLRFLVDESHAGRAEVATVLARIAPESPAVVEALTVAPRGFKVSRSD